MSGSDIILVIFRPSNFGGGYVVEILLLLSVL